MRSAVSPADPALPPPRPLVEVAAELLVVRRRADALQSELLARLEAPEAGDLRALDVAGLGRIAYVRPSDSTSIDGQAAARKLSALGVRIRGLLEELAKVAGRLRVFDIITVTQLPVVMKEIGEQLLALASVEVDDEIPVTHSSRKASLRIALKS